MAWTLLAHTVVFGTNGGGASPAIDTTGADLLVAVQTQYSLQPIGAVTDSKGNTWTPLTSQSNSIAYVAINYAPGPTVGTGHTFALSTVGTVYATMEILAFSGSIGGSPFDVQNGASNGSNTTSIATGSVTPSQSGSLLVTGVCPADNSSTPYTADNGFTVSDSQGWTAGTNEGGAAAYLFQSAAAAINPTWSWTTATLAAAAIAAFKPASILPNAWRSPPISFWR